MMGIEVCTIGGFEEVGKNMTAIKVGEDVILLDMGLMIPSLIELEEDEEIPRKSLTKKQLIARNVIPDDSVIKKWRPKVKAIVISHAHLDHVGGVPYLASDYDCPVVGTPFTIEILKTILKDEKIKIQNPLKILKAGKTLKINKNLKIEFINITHSTIQCVMVVLHTKAGIIVYANDFKLDKNPVIGKKPNFKRMKNLGDSGKVQLLIMDSLYSKSDMKTPSESVAREMLKDVIFGVNLKNNAVFVTTFASHIARLSSIVYFGRKLKRKIILLGRSLHKYVNAAEDIGAVKLTKSVEILSYRSQIKKKLKEIQKNPEKYLIVCTGNQGEPNAVLTRIANDEYHFKFSKDDAVIFSCKTIPDPSNIAHRASLERNLNKRGVRMFKDIHVSGHGAREDLRETVEMLKPKHIIPSHGSSQQLTPMVELAKNMGYNLGRTVHLVHDGQFLTFK